MMTNDDLRLKLDRLSDTQVRAIVREHYAPVAERMGQAERGALQMALMDHVDRAGAAERVRLDDIIALYQSERPKTNGKAKTTLTYTDALSATVVRLDTQTAAMAKTLDENQQRLKEIGVALAPLAKLEIDDWFRIVNTVETLRSSVDALAQQGRVLLSVFMAGTILTLLMLLALVALVMRYAV